MSGHPVERLPFVTTTEFGRNFWSVCRTGSYERDCLLGAAFGRDALRYMGAMQFPVLLGWCVKDMLAVGSAHDGVEIGFLHEIAAAAIGQPAGKAIRR